VVNGRVDIGAVETQPAIVMLSIVYSSQKAVISWPSAAAGWTLQLNVNLATGAWGNYQGTVVNNSITNLPPTRNLFFRLKP
jgi:hypothetical protein